MTTSQSPPAKLRRQAASIAATLKDVEAGKPVPALRDPGGKLAAARKEKTVLEFTIAMDDKLVQVKVAWTLIASLTQDELTNYIFQFMKGEP